MGIKIENKFGGFVMRKEDAIRFLQQANVGKTMDVVLGVDVLRRLELSAFWKTPLPFHELILLSIQNNTPISVSPA